MSTSTAQAQQGQAAKAGLLERLHAKKPVTASYDVVLDPAPVVALSEAQDALSRAEVYEEGVDEAKAALLEAEDAVRDVVVTLHLLGLPRAHYERLLLAHPPSEAQEEKGQTYDETTFAPALVAATVLTDEHSGQPVTEEHMATFMGGGRLPGRAFTTVEVAELFTEWNQGEVAQLYARAVAVCTQARNVHLPKGSGTTRG